MMSKFKREKENKEKEKRKRIVCIKQILNFHNVTVSLQQLNDFSSVSFAFSFLLFLFFLMSKIHTKNRRREIYNYKFYLTIE